MKLICLGSGSSGNCYILDGGDEALIIEAGLPFMAVKKALDFNIRKIVGVVVSHEHKDHSKYAGEYEKAGIPVFKPYEKKEPMTFCSGCGFEIQAFDLTDKYGNFKHNNSDGSECPCYGFYIQHPESGVIVYITDTELIKWSFHGVNHFLVEANYSADLVDPDAVNRNHVLTGHMSLQTTLGFLQANNSPELRNTILCHLSEINADSKEFKRQAEKVVDCPVWIARKGLVVPLNLIPF